ncbi:hypothetical protein B4U79_19223, partial [Dinothrombium tinctorium]
MFSSIGSLLFLISFPLFMFNLNPGTALYFTTFDRLGCRGINDPFDFSKLDKVCEDCYNLFHAAELYTNC